MLGRVARRSAVSSDSNRDREAQSKLSYLPSSSANIFSVDQPETPGDTPIVGDGMATCLWMDPGRSAATWQPTTEPDAPAASVTSDGTAAAPTADEPDGTSPPALTRVAWSESRVLGVTEMPGRAHTVLATGPWWVQEAPVPAFGSEVWGGGGGGMGRSWVLGPQQQSSKSPFPTCLVPCPREQRCPHG